MDKVDEQSFYPGFLKTCSDLELVALQHELRIHPQDRKYLNDVLNELKIRAEKLQPIAKSLDK